MNKFVVRKTENESGYPSADIYLIDENNNFEFICDCGDWKNDSAQLYANKICALLNASIL
jgi:hypothetical protein